MVGRRVLVPEVEVRSLPPQPYLKQPAVIGHIAVPNTEGRSRRWCAASTRAKEEPHCTARAVVTASEQGEAVAQELGTK